jgi:hypothetical protein
MGAARVESNAVWINPFLNNLKTMQASRSHARRAAAKRGIALLGPGQEYCAYQEVNRLQRKILLPGSMIVSKIVYFAKG